MLALDRSHFSPSPEVGGQEPSIDELVRDAAKLLPEQAPLHAFVHHNTLHAFESLPFEDAVLGASRVLGAEPYAQESFFARQVESGRVGADDLRRVVESQIPDEDDVPVAGRMTRRDFRVLRLQHIFEVPEYELLSFCILERGATEVLHERVGDERRAALLKGAKEAEVVGALWEHFSHVETVGRVLPRGVRRRDQLHALTGVDTDDAVHSTLIRLCGAFLDQGVSYWRMPGRQRGFLHAVRDLYALPVPPPDRLFSGLAGVFREQQAKGLSATETVLWALRELAVPKHLYAKYIEESLLALRGWAGMMHRFETRPDQAPVEAIPASLLDYLAVLLVFDTVAAQNLARSLGRSFSDIDDDPPPPTLRGARALRYEAFVLAQALPVDPAVFDDPQTAIRWVDEVRDFDELERRRYLQLAYEQRHQTEVLGGIRARVLQRGASVGKPKFQAVFCIDDREESTRRHLEEACAEVETFGYPGFFGVAMNFKQAEAHKGRPLCPASMRPDHAIVERDVATRSNGPAPSIRVAYHVGRLSLLRGALISALGVLAVIPWLMSTLFRRRLGRPAHEHDETEIAYRRDPAVPARQGELPEGYTVEEMVPIVSKFLEHTGLAGADRLSDLVVVCGHGSTSVNNPHLAAYGCGATGGGCGGFNARVFAMMANDADVRAELGKRGLSIDPGVHFVGALHDTCQDAITWYDEAAVPEALHGKLLTAKQAFSTAMANNAAERCRLFGTVPLRISPEAARREVGIRANDLSEARPEYNHAKNSLCIVGPRAFTRGLFLDQRAFLVSYDETTDPDGALLAEVLTGSLPVSVGINLEYYFSSVDQDRYGAGSKLPHNISGLVGVMDGHASDLRTGLYAQMVELHEPVRLLAVVLAKPYRVREAMKRSPSLSNLVRNRWCYLVCYDVETDTFHGPDGRVLDIEGAWANVGRSKSSSAACLGRREPVSPVLLGA